MQKTLTNTHTHSRTQQRNVLFSTPNTFWGRTAATVKKGEKEEARQSEAAATNGPGLEGGGSVFVGVDSGAGKGSSA